MTEKTLFYLAQLKKIENFSRPVLEAIDYIEKCYFRQDLFTQNIAEIVYLAPTYLCALFKKEVGKTISEYITQVRIEKSKELLTNYHLKLYEIAKAVGYSDSNYFAKNFKKLTGITPSEYRERLML